MFDLIRVVDLEVWAHIGVPDEERARPQRLLITLELRGGDFRRAAKADDVRQTVDYAAVSQWVKNIAEERPRHLIETLAEDIATKLPKLFPIDNLKVEIKKFILPNAQYVSVSIERQRTTAPAIRL
jgi:7,8-dihydroneopterin aldolase/epimerase/oxygenase